MRFKPGKYYKTPEERNEFYNYIKTEYYRGKSTRELADDLGFTRNRTWELLKNAGTYLRKPANTLRGHRADIIKTLARKGYSGREISKKTGTNESVLSVFLRREHLRIFKRNKGCKCPGCCGKHHRDGFCKKHYSRFIRVKKDIEDGLTKKQILKKRPSITQYFITKYFPKNLKINFNNIFIQVLYDCGVSSSQIAEYYKVKDYSVRYHLKKIGVKLRSRGGPNRVLWKDKKIPCKVCGNQYAHTKGMCHVCYNKQLRLKHKRQRIFEQMIDEHKAYA